MITNEKLPDMQKSVDGFHKIPIKKVGVRGNKIPFSVVVKNSIKTFDTVATVSSYCNLDEKTKGANLSRFVRGLNSVISDNDTGFTDLEKFLLKLKKDHNATNSYIKARFEYLIRDKSVMSNMTSFEPVDVEFESVMVDGKIKDYITILDKEVSACPCSYDMSRLVNNINDEEKSKLDKIAEDDPQLRLKLDQATFGVHNQLSFIKIKVEVNRDSKDIMWIEDLVNIARGGSSCEIRSVAKRNDEKTISEQMVIGGYYNDNKEFVKTEGNGVKFTEDIARDTAYALEQELDGKIVDFVVVTQNQESLHPGIEAVSVITAGRDLQ